MGSFCPVSDIYYVLSPHAASSLTVLEPEEGVGRMLF
jgi:hypothetical protein